MLPGCRAAQLAHDHEAFRRELSRMYTNQVLDNLILCQQGLLIRDCSTIPGLSRRTIRVAVRLPRQNDRLVRALRALIG